MPRGVGDWRLVDTGQDFVSWRRELRKYGDEQVASVWVEDSATGDGYIAWAHVEPAATTRTPSWRTARRCRGERPSSGPWTGCAGTRSGRAGA